MKEVRDNIDLQDPLKSFRPGIFEPDDLSDNAPMKLFHLCAKYLVTHINLNPLTRKLPSEVCDNLIEIFRMIGSKSMCGRFLSEIDSKRSRVQDANLSGLEMKNKELFEFVDSHAKTIRMLNILECNRLLPNDVLNKTIETLIQVKDPFRLQREVVCYEVDDSMSEADPIDLKYQGYRFAWMKRYHNQRLTTITPKDTSQKYFIEPFPIDFDKANNRFDVTHIHVPKPLINDYESFQAMGLFDEIGFCELYSQFTPTTIVTESGRRIMIWEGNGQEFIDLNEECGVNKNGCMPMYPICSVPIEDLGEEDLEELEEDAFLAGTDVTGANSTNNVGLNSGGNGGSSSSSAIRSLWSINYNRNLFPPKKRMSNMNEQSKPYGRITRSSSSAAHTSGWINKMNNNASTSSVGSTPSSNPPMTTTTAAAINDVHMREEITDNAMLDGSNNVRENGQNFETEDDDDDDVQPNRFRPISVQHHQPPDINHPHQQVILPTTSIAVTSSNLLASSGSFFPYQVYRYRGDNNRSKIIEIRTWEECPIETLMIGRSTYMFSDDKPSELPFTANQVSEMLFHPQLNNLKRLVIHDWPVDVTSFIKLQLYPAQAARIQHLDLSNCLSIDDGRRLLQLPQLKTLILFNCPNVYKALDNICELKSLRVLDISTSIDTTNSISHQFHEPDQQLSKIVKKLTNLTSLDISGTNLAGLRTDTIIGLEPRNGNPLDFLGIFHTSIEAASRENIPALRIAGDVGENMILTACEAYMNRVDMLRKGLNELFQLFRYESRQHNLERALKILVCSLGRHPSDKLVQVAASATLFYIVKSDEAKPLLGRRIKELIVTRLLDAMQAFRYDQTMLRNGCLNLIHFRIPSDVISEYTRLADILLYIVTNDDDNFVQRLGIYLLNSLACQVDGEQKTIVGNLGAIEKMLQLIEIRFNRSLCDEVMETAWSTMWNVTDETPINCERFLNNNGMEFFVSCMDKFSDCPELLRNMMGLLGNVSECAHLRYRLMKQDYISRFIILLASQSDGIEVSYNSAGILAHIASDGPEIWNRHLEKEKCSREDMLMKMKTAISRWEINSKRNINYRSFEPILRLLRVLSISWQAQYWAVWALANLTRVHCSKYCTLLEKDGGVEVLKYFVTAQRPDNFRLPISVKCLAVVTLFQYFLFRKFKNLKGLDTSDKIMCFYSVPSYLVGEFFHEYDFVHVAEELHINLSAVPQPRIHNQNLGILMENNTVNQRDCDNFEAYDEFNMNYRGLAADEQNVREQDEDEDMLF
ncbi:Protein zer-1 [Blomia tropicalis]|nr:Protein zer-1 [Blomia tropicalis]